MSDFSHAMDKLMSVKEPSFFEANGKSFFDVCQELRTIFWMPLKGDKLPREKATELFCRAINFGNVATIKHEQEKLGLPQTGIMDDETIAKLNEVAK